MKDNHKTKSLSELCGLFGKTRQAFHQKYVYTYKQAVEEHLLLEKIRKIRTRLPRIGGRKLQVRLKSKGVEIGRDVLFRILSSNGLLVKQRRSSKRTTMSSHWLRKYPNLIRHYTPSGPNQLWVSDITYLETKEVFLYLFLITDAYSKKIIGYECAENLNSNNAIAALEMALKSMPAECKGLVHHSDRGVQYLTNKNITHHPSPITDQR